MPAPWLRIVPGLAGGIEVHLQTSRGKTANGKLGAACVMAALCLSFSVTGFGQDASTTTTASPNASTKKTSNSAAKSKKTGSTGSTSASAKTHKSTSSTAHQHSASSKSSATLHNSKSKHSSSRNKKTARGQQKIDSERAQAIQEALIREHYLSGDPTGKWNDDSEAAMRRYQADHGWQSKTVPDSRALISLGLGPNHDHLLNPESAMTTGPFPPRAEPLAPTSNSADPGPQVKTNSPSATTPAQASSPEHDAPNQP